MPSSNSKLEFKRSHIGKQADELTTPALLLRLDRARENIALMAALMKPYSCGLRPHIKCHKSPQLAKMQMDAGAIGLTVATVWEAVAMADQGIDDILIANQVVGSDKLSVLAELSKRAKITVAVDNEQNIDELSKEVSDRDSVIGVLVEYDVGMGRCGVRSKEEALHLAKVVCNKSGLQFEGVMGYEGHCMLEPDPDIRAKKAKKSSDLLIEVADLMESEGIKVPVISSGGTGTYHLTGAHPRVSELQAGSYVIMDEFHHNLMPKFAVAVTVLATVVSRQGSTIVLDCGRKAIGCENCLPRVDVPGIKTISVAEEHLIAQVEMDCAIRVGDRVEVVPGYGPTTVNLYDSFYVIEQERVSDIWSVHARGAYEY
jgi:D-serine deaminase-like pyridoxal phosphate-dependent protein